MYNQVRMAFKLLIIDEGAKNETGLIELLGKDFQVDVCELGHHALERIRSWEPDILVLDADLPDIPSLTFLRMARAMDRSRSIPVLFVHEGKSEEAAVEAFAAGADDCLAKPFDLRELHARLMVALRRRYERAEHWGGPLSGGGIEIEPSQRRTQVGERVIDLRPREFEVLEILMRKAGRVLTRPYLLDAVWGGNTTAGLRAVDMAVSRLRKALGRAGTCVVTVSKLGYVFRTPQSKK